MILLLASDIQSSTALWDRLGPAFAAVLAQHNRIFRETLAAHGGTEIRTEGDAFFISFPEGPAAIRCALALQERLHEAKWPEESGELFVRIGVHAAERSDGPDGALAVEVASAAHGGQVLISGAAAGFLPAGIAATPLGTHKLKGSASQVALLQVAPPSLADRRFPPPRTLSARPTNLPRPGGAFVGRTKEMEELVDVLPKPAGRLVTLTGPGGIGKSRLAIEAAAALLEKFEGGCWHVELTAARGAAGIAHHVAAAFGAQAAGREDPVKAVASLLEFRKPLLLVLDPFEHLVDQALATIGLWKQRAPHVRFLVASRSLVGLSGERELALPPLPFPGHASSLKEIASCEAVRLFVERAREASPGFDGDADVVGKVCRELEGVPLAIEVAAAGLRSRPLAEVAKGLSRTAPGDVLSGALDWSYDGLSAAERSAYAQASIFRGGFFLETAEEVIDLSAFDDAPLAIDAVQALRDRSLIRSSDTKYGTRFSMYRAIREHAQRKLGADAGIEKRFASHFVAMGEQCVAKSHGAAAGEAFDRLEFETDNFFAAEEAALARGDRETAARAVLAIQNSLVVRGPMDQRVPRLEAAWAARPDEPRLCARLAVSLGKAHFMGQDWKRATELIEEAASIARAAALEDSEGACLKELGVITWMKGDPEEALRLLAKAEEIARRIAHALLLEETVGNRGNVHRGRGDYDAAVRDLREAEAIATKRGDASAVARHVGNRAIVHKRRGEYMESLAGYNRARDIYEALGDKRQIAVCLGNLGTLYLEHGSEEQALACFDEAGEIDRHFGCKADLAVDLANKANVFFTRREYDAAKACLDECDAFVRDLGMAELEAYVVALRSRILLEQGDPAGAIPGIERAEALARAAGSLDFASQYQVYRGRALLYCGRAAEAVAPLREARAAREKIGATKSLQHFFALALLARVLDRLGEASEAAAVSREALTMAEHLRLATTGGFHRAEEDLPELKRIAGVP